MTLDQFCHLCIDHQDWFNCSVWLSRYLPSHTSIEHSVPLLAAGDTAVCNIIIKKKNKKHSLWSLYYYINKQVNYIARQVVVKAMKNIMLGRRIESDGTKVAWQYQRQSLFEKVTCGQKLKKRVTQQPSKEGQFLGRGISSVMPWLWAHVVIGVLAQILELLEGSRRERTEKTNSKWWPLQDVNHAGHEDHFKTLAFVEIKWKQKKIKLCSDPRYILKVEPTRFADRFNTGKDNRVRDNSKICGLSLRKRWASYFWSWGNLRRSRFREKRQEYRFSKCLV